MAGISVRGMLDGLALSSGGLLGETTPGVVAYEYFSPLAIVTEGFLFAAGDYWNPTPAAIDPGWLPCDCNMECD